MAQNNIAFQILNNSEGGSLYLYLSSNAMKKLIFGISILFFIAAQSYFIYGLLQPETAESFRQLWASFGIKQTAYSTFVFRTIQWWVALPILCLGLAVFALLRSSKLFLFITILIGFVGTVALYWSVYAPALLVQP